MPLTDFGEQELMDLQWENLQLKNAIIKHFLGVDLEKRPSNQINIGCDERLSEEINKFMNIEKEVEE